MPGKLTLSARFWQKVVETESCWVWQGVKSPHGYGRFTMGRGHQLQAHRVAYEWFFGQIEDGLDMDHLCRNRACVNPTHLEPVTHRENQIRGAGQAGRARWTHCMRGHEFVAPNLYVDPKYGTRKCKACWAIRRAKRRALQGVAA